MNLTIYKFLIIKATIDKIQVYNTNIGMNE